MLTTRHDTANFLHGRCARCCLLPSPSKCWLVHCAGAEDVLSDSHLQSSTLATLRAQLQVLVALIILLAQHWHKCCMGPSSRTTHNSLVIGPDASRYIQYVHTLHSLGRKFWTGWISKLHSHNVQATDKLITHLIFFWTNDALNLVLLYYTILFGLFFY